MEIGIISDTHINSKNGLKNTILYEKIKEAFQDVELIIHAGDITSIEVLNDLRKIAPVEAVCGNVDLPEIMNEYPTFKKLEIHNKKIGISHVLPSISLIYQEKLDIIIHGHTHVPKITEEEINGRVFLSLNPGSPTRPRTSRPLNRYLSPRPPIPSVMILNIDDEISSAYIVGFKLE